MEASIQDQEPTQEPVASAEDPSTSSTDSPLVDAEPSVEQEQNQPDGTAEPTPSGAIVGTIPMTQEDLDNLHRGDN